MSTDIRYLAEGIALFCVFLLPMFLPFYDVIRRLAGVPFNRRQVGLCFLFTLANWCTSRVVILYAAGWNVVASLLWYVPIVLVLGKRGWDFLLVLLKLFLALVGLELICALLVAVAERLGLNPGLLLLATVEDLHNPAKLLGASLLNLLAMLVQWLLVVAGGHLLRLHRSAPPRQRKRRWHIAFSMLRLLLLLTAAISTMAMPHYLFGVSSLTEFLLPYNERYILLVISVGALLGVACSYMVQDIRYLAQSQQINTLEQQQAISRALLQNLRFFRHNIINMLYGLEGAMLSDDRSRFKAYFAEIQEKCALINNENITALERVTNPSVNALLLRTMDRARKMDLPINLFVLEGLQLPHVLSDTDLCQVLGVLLDNALEAANTASSRHVLVELRSVGDAAELIITNTYSGTIGPEQLSACATSSKAGHSGQGLASCYHLLSRKRGAFLNFWVTGQYVKAQLLLQR